MLITSQKKKNKKVDNYYNKEISVHSKKNMHLYKYTICTQSSTEWVENAHLCKLLIFSNLIFQPTTYFI